MRVLLIGHEKACNGATKSLLDIADTLRARGHSVFVLAPHSEGPFYEELSKRSIPTTVGKYYWWAANHANNIRRMARRQKYIVKNIFNRLLAHKMAKYVIENDIDIIHSNTGVINIGALISHYSGVPHVWHLREFVGGDSDLQPLISDEAFFRFMNEHCSKFICPSQALANHYHELADEKKCVIYNGVAKQNFLARSTADYSNKDSVRLLIAGIIQPPKGQNYAVAACAKLYEMTNQRFDLYLAGTGDPYFDIPQAITPRVHMLGQVDDMPALRGRIDIELVCSKIESFGRVTAEAMLAGIPVIGTNTGGTPELIQDGITGLLYDYGDTDQLAGHIHYLLENPGIRMEMGQRAQEYAREHFIIERCVDEIEEVYQSVLNERRSIA